MSKVEPHGKKQIYTAQGNLSRARRRWRCGVREPSRDFKRSHARKLCGHRKNGFKVVCCSGGALWCKDSLLRRTECSIRTYLPAKQFFEARPAPPESGSGRAIDQDTNGDGVADTRCPLGLRTRYYLPG